ncbi:DUF4435 domain-containing protein [Aeromonas hydrophila]
MTAISSGTSFPISSKMFAASEIFNGNNSIRVYVEGFEDVPFWKRILKNENVPITVIAFGEASKANGKGTIIKSINDGTLELGERLIVALDSDYDYLLDRNVDIFQQITVLQTYSHSIENLIWHPNKIDEVCQTASKDTVYFTDNKIQESILNWSRNIYSSFLKFLQSGATDVEKFNAIIDSLSLTGHEISFTGTAEEFDDEEFKSKMLEKGLSPDTTFLFVRGHDYAEKIEKICQALNEEAYRIRKKAILESGKCNAGQLAGEAKNLQQEPREVISGFPISCDICIPKIKRDFDSFIKAKDK